VEKPSIIPRAGTWRNKPLGKEEPKLHENSRNDAEKADTELNLRSPEKVSFLGCAFTSTGKFMDGY
jgi:hypothetical protein